MIDLEALVARIHLGELSEDAAERELQDTLERIAEEDRGAAMEVLVRGISARVVEDLSAGGRPAAANLAATGFVHALAVRSGIAGLIAGTAFTTGLAAMRARKPDAASRYLALAVERFDHVERRLIARDDLVGALMATGDLRGARSQAESWLAEARAAGQRGSEACAHRALGMIAEQTGRNDRAIEHHRAAVALRDQLTDDECDGFNVPDRARFHEQLARAYRWLGLYEEATIAFQIAHDDRAAAGDLGGVAWFLSELGFTAQRVGEEARAAELLARAAAVARQAGNLEAAARWELSMGAGAAPAPIAPVTAETPPPLVYAASTRATAALRDGRRTPEVAATLRSLVDWAHAHGDPHVEVVARANLVNLIAAENGFLGALKARSAAHAARRHGDEVSWLHMQGNFIRCCLTAGDLARRAARPIAVAALDRYAALLAATTSSEFRQQIRAGQAFLAESYALLLLGEDDHRALIEMYESVRARTLGTWLRGRSTAGAERLESLRALQRLEVEAEARYAGGAVTSEWLRDHLAAREQVLASLPPLDEPPGSAWYDAGEILAAHPGAVALYLFGVPEGVIATAIRRDGDQPTASSCWISWPREERLVTIGRLLGKSLGSADDGHRSMEMVPVRAFGERDFTSAGAGAPCSPAETLATLRAKLAPAAALLGRPLTRLAVVAHRELALVPLADALGLAADTAVTQAPSLSVLRECLRRSPPADAAGIVVRDPTGTLPFAMREIADASFAVVDDTDLARLVGDAADAAELHFASHGLFNTANPYYSGVIVFPEAPPGDGDPRYAGLRDHEPRLFVPAIAALPAFRLLTVVDILSRLHLRRAPLVILSACESGVPRLHGADEQTGLPAAFLVAGARTVIATLARVRDDVAFLVMQAFRVAPGASPATRLAHARHAVRTMPRAEVLERLGAGAIVPDGDHPFAAPVLAAPFQCYGAW